MLKYSVFDDWVMSLVWIAPTQFVKSSNLSQVVDVADKDGLPALGQIGGCDSKNAGYPKLAPSCNSAGCMAPQIS